MVQGVEQIVSSSVIKVVQKEDGETVSIQTSIWNKTVVNLSLMALVSYSPQILLHFLDVILKVENKPAPMLGP